MAQAAGNFLQTFHLEADVVKATPGLAALSAGYRIVLEVENCQVDIAVAQVVAARARTVDFADFRETEHFLIKASGGLDVLRRDRDVLDLRHGVPPSVNLRH